MTVEQEQIIDEQVKIIAHAIGNIYEVDEGFGAVLDNSFRLATNIIEDRMLGRGTDYFAAFEAMVGISVKELVDEVQKMKETEVDQEILDFITTTDESDEYQKKVDEFKKSISDV